MTQALLKAFFAILMSFGVAMMIREISTPRPPADAGDMRREIGWPSFCVTSTTQVILAKGTLLLLATSADSEETSRLVSIQSGMFSGAACLVPASSLRRIE